ncbi:MAG: nitroreductase family protein [Muribaculaceae bacterium]|nr:nitroreductase family protein [Muribaculaceae bacterium]
MTFDELRRLMINNRTVRRFDGSRPVSLSDLEKLVELVRYTPSGRNAQPLKYRIVTDPEERERVYPLMKWAGYFTEWDGPDPSERPTAYLIQCLDSEYGRDCLCDDGLQLEAITLGMHTMGLAGCIIKAFNHVAISEELKLDNRFLPRYVLAIGYPAEDVRIEDMSGEKDADFKYYRTPDGIHHVPKRPLSELIITPEVD